MSDMPNCVFVVTAEIDPAQEEAWNKWYDEVHLPDALACPGVIRGTRYLHARDASLMDHGQAGDDGARVYVTLYEFDSPEAMDTPEFQAMRGWYQFADHIKARTQVFLRR